ncbi:AAA family ATPase [Butyrivibrio sp. NC3005]|uniref:AAA family ATPase n=1 Tax=Butyrivibrio sp. NC3005 TaxID=1280685 RepID=UPI00040E500E|nr:AAA family ATPase [Butyrivibrio sp. NC3005]
MGLYVNPGKQRFQMALNSDIYVDKTLMITYLNSVLNTNQRYISISRPRRFGKTMAVDMVCAYYDRTTSSREIFENTKLSQNESCDDKSWDKYLQKFDVIRLVMTDFIRKDSTVIDSMNLIRKRIMANWLMQAKIINIIHAILSVFNN